MSKVKVVRCASLRPEHSLVRGAHGHIGPRPDRNRHGPARTRLRMRLLFRKVNALLLWRHDFRDFFEPARTPTPPTLPRVTASLHPVARSEWRHARGAACSATGMVPWESTGRSLAQGRKKGQGGRGVTRVMGAGGFLGFRLACSIGEGEPEAQEWQESHRPLLRPPCPWVAGWI